MTQRQRVQRTPVNRAVRHCLALSLPCLALGFADVHAADDSGDAVVLDQVVVEGGGFFQPTEQTGQYRAPASSSATGLTLTPRETPQSLSVITSLQLEDFQLDDVNSALESTPGVTVEQPETDRTYYTSRGFTIQRFQIDGVGAPLPYDNVQGDIDTAVYDRIEVVRGANGLMSGSGTPSATVNFIRKRPTAETQASASVSAGSWDRRRIEGDVSGSLFGSDRVRGRLVVAAEEGDSYLDRHGRERQVAYGVIEADLTDSTLLTAGHTWQNNDSDSPLWGALPMYYGDGSPTNYDRSASSSPEWSYWDNEDHRSFVEVQQFLPGGWEATLTGSYLTSDSDSEIFYLYDPAQQLRPGTTEDLSIIMDNYRYENEQWVADAQAKGPFDLFGREHEAMVGVNWSKSEVTDYSARLYETSDIDVPLDQWDGNYPRPTFGPSDGGSDFTQEESSIYGATRLSLTDRTTAIFGARATWLENSGVSYTVARESEYDAEIVPYAGLVYDLTDTLSAYASYTEIFEPQNEVTQNYQPLPPIEGRSYEVGLKAALFDERVDATAAVFRTEQNNTATLAGTFNNPRPGYFNYYEASGDLTSEGIELTLAGEILPGWRASGGYTYLEIEDSDGERARTFIPEQMLRAQTTYQLPFWPQMTVGGQIRWQSETFRDQQYNTGQTRQDDYLVTDLMARYEFSDNLSASLNVNNVGNEKYLNSVEYDQAFYGEPRNVMLTLDWKY
ncbi:TonB-dependent siderophore receptor [Guyparkeria hydrothermalis]|uniref:TonB-dependent siderophore receptor n=1 Tax=Guyparkeria hydrothermalis TaxID=923 RepID=UPI00201FC9BF|nr:TonB-dependent siderophore receptor [Guyparkeria hydrothermalis]MCL7751422.1 TonB-dependent siderophore receptor [Guyparkeria hydrothermalis]